MSYSWNHIVCSLIRWASFSNMYLRFSHVFSGEGNGTSLQYSCLENPMDGGAWWAAVHGVAKSQTRLSDFTFTFHFSLWCIGEGNGNPLQCSCLENPRDRGAAVYGLIVHFILMLNIISFSGLCLCICSSTVEHLGCFQVLAIMNKAALNLFGQVFKWI